MVVAILHAHVFNPRTTGDAYKKELSFDCFCYYLYLPRTFIYDDIKMQNQDTLHCLFDKYKPSPTFYQIYQIENGNWTPNYTSGLALVWLPAFTVGHVWATLSDDYVADGMSFPYQFSIAIGTLLMILPGLFVLRKVLLKFFSDTVSALTLLFIVFGTIYFHEAFDDYLQPNALLFTGYSLLLYNTILWHETQQRKNAVYIGLLMGIMILIHPSEILCVLIPLLWKVYDKQSFKVKLDLVKNNFPHVVYTILATMVVALPQIAYWKIVTDSYVFFSYQRTEGFDFAHPHFIETLFSFKKSLLIYTPLIVFPLLGFVFLRKEKKEIYFSILSYVILNFLLLGSWSCWWQGGSFGARYFTESFAVLALPFGFLIKAVLQSKMWLKVLTFGTMFLLLCLNLFQTWQYVNWIIPADRMNWAYYKRIWLKTEATAEDRSYMEIERSIGETEGFNNEKDYNRRTVGFFNFENVNSETIDQNRCDTFSLSKPYSFRYGPNEEWGPTFTIPYEYLLKEGDDHVWLRVSLDYYAGSDIKDNITSLVINMPHGKYLLKYRSFDFDKYPFVSNAWNHIAFDYMTPFPYLESDKIELYLWHRGKKSLYIDNLHIEAFHKKR